MRSNRQGYDKHTGRNSYTVHTTADSFSVTEVEERHRDERQESGLSDPAQPCPMTLDAPPDGHSRDHSSRHEFPLRALIMVNAQTVTEHVRAEPESSACHLDATPRNASPCAHFTALRHVTSRQSSHVHEVEYSSGSVYHPQDAPRPKEATPLLAMPTPNATLAHLSSLPSKSILSVHVFGG